MSDLSSKDSVMVESKEEIPQDPSLPIAEKNNTFDGEVKDFAILNGYPMYKKGHILDGRCQIFERCGWDDSKGPTWLAIGPSNKELVLRVSSDKQKQFTAKYEATFLCKAEQHNLWQKFSQVHSIFHYDDCTFLALYFRGGPTLKECLDFAKKQFSHGTAGRLAEDILDIILAVHKLGYRNRDLDLDMFHLDAASRHLFMADISSIREAFNGKHLPVEIRWKGGPYFAPLVFHKNQNDNGLGAFIHERDELEAWFYIFLHMVKELPWYGADFYSTGLVKTELFPGTFFDDLPAQYREIYEIISDSPSIKPVSDEEFGRIKELVQLIYKNAGIKDHDDNFDFEYDPCEDELPRFVAERVRIDDKENDAETKDRKNAKE